MLYNQKHVVQNMYICISEKFSGKMRVVPTHAVVSMSTKTNNSASWHSRVHIEYSRIIWRAVFFVAAVRMR